MAYYYFMASLPSLRYDAPSPVTMEYFLDGCRTNLSASDWRLVQDAVSGKKSRNPFLGRWQKFAGMLKGELNEQRARKLGLSAESYANREERSIAVQNAVRSALAEPNALKAEMILIALQWHEIDEMSAGHVFDTDAVLAYALKLGIITRKNLFTQEAGNKEFKRLYGGVEAQIK